MWPEWKWKKKKEVPRHTRIQNRIHLYHISRTGVCHRMIQSLLVLLMTYFSSLSSKGNIATLPSKRTDLFHCWLAPGGKIIKPKKKSVVIVCPPPGCINSFIFTPFIQSVLDNRAYHINYMQCQSNVWTQSLSIL